MPPPCTSNGLNRKTSPSPAPPLQRCDRSVTHPLVRITIEYVSCRGHSHSRRMGLRPPGFLELAEKSYCQSYCAIARAWNLLSNSGPHSFWKGAIYRQLARYASRTQDAQLVTSSASFAAFTMQPAAQCPPLRALPCAAVESHRRWIGSRIHGLLSCLRLHRPPAQLVIRTRGSFAEVSGETLEACRAIGVTGEYRRANRRNSGRIRSAQMRRLRNLFALSGNPLKLRRRGAQRIANRFERWDHVFRVADLQQGGQIDLYAPIHAYHSPFRCDARARSRNGMPTSKLSGHVKDS